MAKTALVTGAASGIGKAAAKGLAAKGFDVTILVRSPEKGEAAAKQIREASPSAKVEVLLCDLASQRSIRDAAAQFLRGHPRLDVLVNCAGVFVPTRVATEDGLESTFATNVVAYYLLTDLLLPALQKAEPSRIVFVSSRYGGARLDFDDLQFEKRKYGYFKSTPPTMLGRVLVMQEFAQRLEGTGVVANAVHPGLVAHTQLLSETGGFFRWMTNRFGKSPEVGAKTVVWLAAAPEAATLTGKLWHKRKALKTPGQGADPEARQRLWGELERITAASRPG